MYHFCISGEADFFDFNDLMEEVVSMLHYLVSSKSVNMTLAFKDDRSSDDKLDETSDIQSLFSGIRGDRQRYKQVLSNVLVNAINLASENGNVSIICTVLDIQKFNCLKDSKQDDNGDGSRE